MSRHDAPAAVVTLRSTGSRTRDALAPALLGWLAARLAVVAGFGMAHLLTDRVWMPDGHLHLDQGLVTWDGTYYRVLAEGWYAGATTPADATRFFPLFPGLARLLDPVLPGGAGVPLVVVANLAAVAAAVLVWQLAHDVLGRTEIARRATWMVAVIPAANVFVFAYSESVMLAVFTAALLALHHRRLGWLGLLGVAAGALRPAGVLLAVPVAVGAWEWWRSSPPRERMPAAMAWVAAVVAPLAGLMTALATIAVGSGVGWSEPFERQRLLRGGFRDPFTRLVEAVVDIAGGHLHDVYNLTFAVGFAALLAVAVRRRQPLSWLAFMAVTWVVAVGGNNMDSVGRYCTVAAPFTIALAQWARSGRREIAVATVGLLGTAWFTTEVLLGRIIP